MISSSTFLVGGLLEKYNNKCKGDVILSIKAE